MNKQQIYDEIVKLTGYAQETSRYLWNNPEVGGKEKASADEAKDLKAKFEEAGATIELK